MSVKKIRAKECILFVIDAYHIGGATAFLKQHAVAAHRLGYTILIIGAKGTIADPQKEFPFATVRVLPNLEGYNNIFARLIWFTAMWKTINSIFEIYNIVLIYTPLVYSYWSILFCRKSWKIPRVYAFCGDIVLEAESQFPKSAHKLFSFKNSIRYLLQYLALLTSMKIVTFSTYAKTILKQRYPLTPIENIIIIPGYAKIQIPPTQKRTGVFELLTISRFEPRKGLDNLLKAAYILKKEKVNFHLTIAGGCHSVHFIDIFKLYEDLDLFKSVTFIHKVSESQISQLLSMTDLYIVPSIDLETFGMMTLTALSHGVPVIGTPTGATPEILTQIHERLISKSITAEEIAITIRWYLSQSYKNRQQIQSNIFSTVLNQYNPHRINESITALFLNIISKNK